MTKISNQYSLTNVLFADAVNGRVGIGTATPSKPLEVYGPTLNTAQLKLFGASSTNGKSLYLGGYGNGSYITSGGTFSNGWVADIATTAICSIQFDSQNAESNIAFYTTTTNNTGPNERMRIAGNGNVGIGTSSPAYRLHVTGTALLKGVGNAGRLECEDDGITNITINPAFSSTGTPAIQVQTNHPLLFCTNNIERMRITNSGFLKASPNANFIAGDQHELNTNISGRNTMYNINSSSNPYGNYISFSAAAPNNLTNYYLYFDDTSNIKFLVYSNGSVYNRTGVYAAISDIKLKENIVDATPKLDDLLKVKIRNYNLIGDELKQIGVIAQELEEIFPNMIDNTVDKDTGETTKGVKYSIFIPMLIKGLQEQQTQINELKALLNA